MVLIRHLRPAPVQCEPYVTAYGKWLPRTGGGFARDLHIKRAIDPLESRPIVADGRRLPAQQVLMTTNYRMSITNSALIGGDMEPARI